MPKLTASADARSISNSCQFSWLSCLYVWQTENHSLYNKTLRLLAFVWDLPSSRPKRDVSNVCLETVSRPNRQDQDYIPAAHSWSWMSL